MVNFSLKGVKKKSFVIAQINLSFTIIKRRVYLYRMYKNMYSGLLMKKAYVRRHLTFESRFRLKNCL